MGHNLSRSPIRIKRGKGSITLPYDRALDEMRTGARLMLLHSNPEGCQHYIVPGGKVSDDTAEHLKAHPSVVVESDGLFSGVPQTWRMRSFVEPKATKVIDSTTQSKA